MHYIVYLPRTSGLLIYDDTTGNYQVVLPAGISNKLRNIFVLHLEVRIIFDKAWTVYAVSSDDIHLKSRY